MLSHLDEIKVLPDGYHQIFARARRVLEEDQRVRAMWLGGSLARGSADAASDLDVLVAVADDGHESFTSSWRTWLADITPTVLAEELPFAKGSFYSVTPAFERFDVVVEPVSTLPTTLFRTRTVVFDRDGLTAGLPEADPAPGPSAASVTALVTEYFRVSAMETIVVRDDWLLAREYLHGVASLIYRLFVEANAPLPAMGVKQWSAKLTPPQREAMASLPTTAATIEELRAAHRAMAALFVTNAEALIGFLGGTWPEDLERAAAAHLADVLDLVDAHPRTGRVVVERQDGD